MHVGRPDLAALVLAAHEAARAMNQRPMPAQQVVAFFEELLYRPQSDGGKDFWGCFAEGLITPEELRDAVLAHLASWLSYMNHVAEPSSDTWCSPELDHLFDTTLFAVPDPATHAAAVRELAAAINAAADAEVAGAVLRLEADAQSVEVLRQGGESDDNIDDTLVRASHVTIGAFHGVIASARMSWREHQFVLMGSRQALVDSATALLTRLLHHPRFGRLGWRLILTRILPHEGRRTMAADPGYDLAKAPKSFVAWVEPYSDADWQESQRYPTTTIIVERS